MVKSTGCLSRGTGFNSQHLHDRSKTICNSSPKVLLPSSGTRDVHMWFTDICACQTPTHINSFFKCMKAAHSLVCGGGSGAATDTDCASAPAPSAHQSKLSQDGEYHSGFGSGFCHLCLPRFKAQTQWTLSP